jgi:hypothetical protein
MSGRKAYRLGVEWRRWRVAGTGRIRGGWFLAIVRRTRVKGGRSW